MTEEKAVNITPLADGEDKRRAKRKVALLMGFCGTGYHGMQFQNSDVPTIEAELVKALAKTGAIEECNMDSLHKIQFQRCARTDKGVHALGQVVSCKLVIPQSCENTNESSVELAKEVNKHLPDQIRVWGHVRTNDKFNAKNRCSGRLYEYLLPSYCLRPFSDSERDRFGVSLNEEEISNLKKAFETSSANEKKVEDDGNESGDDEAEPIANEVPDKQQQLDRESMNITPAEMEEIRKYRVSSDEMSK
eukprot:Partr_v1_DN28090_c1_g1_i3_m57115 putative Trna pseudouridine synthase